VRGGLSGYIGANDLPEIKYHFPKAQLKTVPNAGHWVHAEKPEELSALVEEFWSKQ
jgi:pimeloyl-ACP methyl ester carboxylesterase